MGSALNFKSVSRNYLPLIYSEAGAYALNAMDAVSFAERLKERGAEEKQHIKLLSIRGILILSDKGLPQKIEDVIGDSESRRAKDSVANRIDQKLKPAFLEFCEMVVSEGRHKEIDYLKDLLSIEGCDIEFKKNVDDVSLRKWARTKGIVFKTGRPSKK